MSETKEFFTVKEVAQRLRVTPDTIYRLVRRGELPCIQIGRAKRFRWTDVEEFLGNATVRKKHEAEK